MANPDSTGKLYDKWRQAEAAYADVLSAFGGDSPPDKVRKSAALELAKARNTADQARDKFFKRTLK